MTRVDTKICCRCKRNLPIDQFRKRSAAKDGLSYSCKDCDREKGRIFAKKVYMNNPSKELEKKREWNLKHKESVIKSQKKSTKTYYWKNKEIIIQKGIEWKYKKYKEDPNFQILGRLRSRLNHALKGKVKSDHTLDLLGCTVEELKQHLENQFQEGMTWQNCGKNGWEIDHIIPCSYFDLSIEENQYICFNFRNLQPLWAKDNLQKSNNIPENVEELIENLRKEIRL